jgi:hypothetical protein
MGLGVAMRGIEVVKVRPPWKEECVMKTLGQDGRSGEDVAMTFCFEVALARHKALRKNV